MTEKRDLSKYVLAEHVAVTANGGSWDVTFNWLCPNCSQYHHGREFGCNRGFEALFTTLACGECYVRMPWAATPVPRPNRQTDRSITDLRSD
jgi:hypothetical protein